MHLAPHCSKCLQISENKLTCFGWNQPLHEKKTHYAFIDNCLYENQWSCTLQSSCVLASAIKSQSRQFLFTLPVSITLYLITHNHPHDTKGQVVTWHVPASPQMCHYSLSGGGGGGGGWAGGGDELHIQFILKCDRQWTHPGLVWPCVLKGNKRSILLK